MLKEPAALWQLGFAPDAALLDLVLYKLSRRYREDSLTLVKANVPVNLILPDITARRPSDPAILLYWNLADYLMAILRSDNHRGWLRNVTAGLPVGVEDNASDAVRAAALWAAQMERFAAALGVMPNARSLDASHFFAQPTKAVMDCAELFGIECSAATVADIVSGPLFSNYSKRPDVAFTNADRMARVRETSTSVVAEIAEAVAWLGEQGRPHDALEARVAAGALMISVN